MVNIVLSFIKVWWFFKSFKKASLWFEIENPLLGGVSPTHMIDMGREDKLYKIITQALEENKLPKRYKK